MYLAEFENTLRICSNNDIQMSFFLSDRAEFVTGWKHEASLVG